MGSLKKVKHFALDWGTCLKILQPGDKSLRRARTQCVHKPEITFTGKLTVSNTIDLVSVIKLFQSLLIIDYFHQTFRDNNHFANLPAFEVRLDFGGSQCQLLSFFFVGYCSHFQGSSDFPIYLDNQCYHIFSDQVLFVFLPRLLMDTSAILRKVLLIQILQKQNETDRIRKKSVVFYF